MNTTSRRDTAIDAWCKRELLRYYEDYRALPNTPQSAKKIYRDDLVKRVLAKANDDLKYEVIDSNQKKGEAINAEERAEKRSEDRVLHIARSRHRLKEVCIVLERKPKKQWAET